MDLHDAPIDLSEADLSGTHLRKADLSRARVSDEQLAEAASYHGATTPTGHRMTTGHRPTSDAYDRLSFPFTHRIDAAMPVDDGDVALPRGIGLSAWA
jgi:hypothetical protein